MPLPVLIYDGDCGFCTRTITMLLADPRRPMMNVQTWQEIGIEQFGISEQRATREMLWVHRDGRVAGGALAFAELFRHWGGPWRVPDILLRIPPTRWIAAAVYRAVANNRHRMPGGTTACTAPQR
ncbi:thiol-disulfide oxidoreductase DCC family protein [Streptomyces sparsus]